MHRDLQVASLQGYLLKNKRRPRECVGEVTEWCGTVNSRIGVTGKLWPYVLNRVKQERTARALGQE
jgi:hypothetical protein